jgi:hypothetical protein
MTWTATRITLHGAAGQLPAGVDGEAVQLELPVVCEIHPRALHVLLPSQRHRQNHRARNGIERQS